MFLFYYRDFFEQICSDVQFISPSEEVGEFLLHLLKIDIPILEYIETYVNYLQRIKCRKKNTGSGVKNVFALPIFCDKV